MSNLPIGLQLNNPGNIRKSAITYKGEVPNNYPDTDIRSQFKQFESPDKGYRAMASLLYAYIMHHGLDTIRKIINTYSPAGDGSNNPDKYANDVSNATGIGVDEQLGKQDFLADQPVNARILRIIMGMETEEEGLKPVSADALQGFTEFLTDEGLI